MTIDDIIHLLGNGAGFRIPASGKAKNDLLHIAALAGAMKKTVTFTRVNHKPLSDLDEITAEGNGFVVFDLTEE